MYTSIYVHPYTHPHTVTAQFPTERNEYLTALCVLLAVCFPHGILYIMLSCMLSIHLSHIPWGCICSRGELWWHSATVHSHWHPSERAVLLPPREAALLNNAQGKPHMQSWRFSTLVLVVAVSFVLFPSFGSLLQNLVPSQSLLFHNHAKVQNPPMTTTLAQWPLSWCNISLPSRENRKR